MISLCNVAAKVSECEGFLK